MQNLIYALIQLVHNENAAAIVALGAYGVWKVGRQPAPRLAWTLTALWGLQAATGALFGIVTYGFDRHLPDIHGIAIQALLLKMLCVVLGIGSRWMGRWIWSASLLLGIIALGSAAFLRWFS